VESLQVMFRAYMQGWQGWPEPHIYTVYDRISSDFPVPKVPCIHRMYMVLANPTYRAMSYTQ